MIKQIKAHYVAEQIMPLSEADGVHHRQGLLENWNQSKLKNAKIGIVGAGGLGGHTANSLAREGCGRIVICDFDEIELSNLNRQLFYKDQVTKNKAIELGKNLIKECTDSSNIDSFALPFNKTIEKYPEAFFGADIILCLVDNNLTRVDVAKYGLKYDVPIVLCGVSENAKCGYVFIQKSKSGCFNCLWSMDNKGAEEKRNQCNRPSVIYIHQIMSGIVSYVTTGLIMDWTIPWTYLEIDIDGYIRSLNKIPRKDDCKLCGNIR